MNHIKKELYKRVPKKTRIFLKKVYYLRFILPFHKLRNLLVYGRSDIFNVINIETTTYCNLRCACCPNSIYDRGLLKNKKLMRTKLFKKIIDDLAKIKYRDRFALHLYGEPLSDKRLCEFVRYIKKRCPRSKIGINSNGFLLTIPLYKDLIASGADNILISQYEKSVPPGCKKVLEYLKTRLKKENIIIYRIFDGETGSDAMYNRGGEIKLENLPDLPSCVYPVKVAHIDYNGNFLICAQDYHSTIPMGNLEKEDIIDIWRMPRYKKLRKQLDKFDFRLELCKKCVGEIK